MLMRAAHGLPNAASTRNPVKKPRRSQLWVRILLVSPLRPYLLLLLRPQSPRAAGLVSGWPLVVYLLKMPTTIINTTFPSFK
jgi:O-antigen ligase